MRTWFARDGLCGLLAVSAGLGVAELLAGFTGPQSDPVVAVGEGMIDRTPEWLKEFAIGHFGTHDKQVLLAGLGVGVTVLAIVVGVLAGRRLAAGLAGLGAFGLLGMAAALDRPASRPVDALPSLLGSASGALALAVLRARTATSLAAERSVEAGKGRRRLGRGSTKERRLVAAPVVRRWSGAVPVGRRGFVLTAAGVAAMAAGTGGLGRWLAARRNVNAARAAVRLPSPAEPAPPLPPGTDLPIPGITPFTTPNQSFYRVDTALVTPEVDPTAWRLRLHGMVDHPRELTFEELLHRPLRERDVTLTCVSNQVGGVYVGNARWLGASLRDLLNEAGIRPGADQVLSRSADGMTITTPIEAILGNPDAMLAVGMNGQPLPIVHGFPVRMVVPGLYGYLSATKWVVDLKVTTFSADRAYWTVRGYSDDAPIKTMSRIDVPKALAHLSPGRQPVAGVAWAQTRGISAVQVRVDGGRWMRAELAPVPGSQTWRQWVLEWDATPGDHLLEVRATDGTGAVQPDKRVPPFPNGATGWHSIAVTVG